MKSGLTKNTPTEIMSGTLSFEDYKVYTSAYLHAVPQPSCWQEKLQEFGYKISFDFTHFDVKISFKLLINKA